MSTQVNLKEGLVVNLVGIDEKPIVESISGNDCIPVTDSNGNMKRITYGDFSTPFQSGVGSALLATVPSSEINAYNLIGGSGSYTNFPTAVSTPLVLSAPEVAANNWQAVKNPTTGFWIKQQVKAGISKAATLVETDESLFQTGKTVSDWTKGVLSPTKSFIEPDVTAITGVDAGTGNRTYIFEPYFMPVDAVFRITLNCSTAGTINFCIYTKSGSTILKDSFSTKTLTVGINVFDFVVPAGKLFGVFNSTTHLGKVTRNTGASGHNYGIYSIAADVSTSTPTTLPTINTTTRFGLQVLTRAEFESFSDSVGLAVDVNTDKDVLSSNSERLQTAKSVENYTGREISMEYVGDSNFEDLNLIPNSTVVSRTYIIDKVISQAVSFVEVKATVSGSIGIGAYEYSVDGTQARRIRFTTFNVEVGYNMLQFPLTPGEYLGFFYNSTPTARIGYNVLDFTQGYATWSITSAISSTFVALPATKSVSNRFAIRAIQKNAKPLLEYNKSDKSVSIPSNVITARGVNQTRNDHGMIFMKDGEMFAIKQKFFDDPDDFEPSCLALSKRNGFGEWVEVSNKPFSSELYADIVAESNPDYCIQADGSIRVFFCIQKTSSGEDRAVASCNVTTLGIWSNNIVHTTFTKNQPSGTGALYLSSQHILMPYYNRTGVGSGSGDSYPKILESVDGGVTWADKGVTIDDPATHFIAESGLYKLDDGRIVCYGRSATLGVVRYCTSSDNGVTFSNFGDLLPAPNAMSSVKRLDFEMPNGGSIYMAVHNVMASLPLVNPNDHPTHRRFMGMSLSVDGINFKFTNHFIFYNRENLFSFEPNIFTNKIERTVDVAWSTLDLIATGGSLHLSRIGFDEIIKMASEL